MSHCYGGQCLTMTDARLLEVLAAWQHETRQLLAELHPREHPEGVLPSRELNEGIAAIRHFRWSVFPRETRKQRFLWPVLADRLYGDRSVLDELRERKQLFELAMVRLRWSDERSRHYDRQVSEFVATVMDYVDCETRLLPRIGTQVPAADQLWVTARLTAPQGWSPVQPHPDLPAAPWVIALFGPMVGVLDRVRDRFATTPG